MTTKILLYFDILTQQVKDKISNYITDKTINHAISTALEFHLMSKGSVDFQDYYLRTISNTEYFLSANNFFRVFKKRYALQAIDNNYLDWLEQEKQSIIQLIDNNQLTKLYFNYFARAQILHNNEIVVRDLGSFFTKFVHTFKPNDFCPLDNPIKKYFGLSRESFYIAFLIVSRAYREWTTDNKRLIEQIRQRLKQLDKTARLESDRMTDLKLLDLIFWYEANRG